MVLILIDLQGFVGEGVRKNLALTAVVRVVGGDDRSHSVQRLAVKRGGFVGLWLAMFFEPIDVLESLLSTGEGKLIGCNPNDRAVLPMEL